MQKLFRMMIGADEACLEKFEKLGVTVQSVRMKESTACRRALFEIRVVGKLGKTRRSAPFESRAATSIDDAIFERGLK